MSILSTLNTVFSVQNDLDVAFAIASMIIMLIVMPYIYFQILNGKIKD